MKICFALLLMTVSAFGATVTVTQPVTGPDGNPGNGTVSFRISAACTSGSSYVGNQTITTTFLAGAFSFGLVPNDTCVTANGKTGTTYLVGWRVCSATAAATLSNPCPNGRGTSWSESWLVTSTNPTATVEGVLVSTSAPPSYSISALASGTYCVSVAGGVAVVTAMSACGGSALSLASLSNASLHSLTNAQLTSLSN